ncbi:MAG: NHL repeat-containing protein [Vulcanimicrobiaceae bacterium]
MKQRFISGRGPVVRALRAVGMLAICATTLTAATHAGRPAAKPSQWLYVSDSTHTLRAYKLPLSSAPRAVAVLTNPGNGPGYGLAVDRSGRVYVAEANADLIGVFAPNKKTGRMVKMASIQTAKPAYDVAVDAAGNLYAAEPSGNAIEVFRAPIKSSSRAAFSITGGIENAYGLAFGPHGVLFVCNDRSVKQYHPPFRAGSRSAGTVAVSGQSQPDFGQGIVVDTKADVFFGYGTLVHVTKPPYTKGASSAYDIVLPPHAVVMYLTFDRRGNLYVAAQFGSGNAHNGVYLFNAPLKSGAPNAYARFIPLDQATGLTVAPKP